MSLYDMLEEISEKKVTKSATGDTRIDGVVIGVVAKNYHQDMPGRVCVTIPTRDKDLGELKWARQALPASGAEWGHYFLPEVGDQVLLAFEGGNIERPYIIGCVPKENNNFLKKSVDQDNQIKRIVTKHGSAVVFTDHKEGDGEKDKVLIETAGQAHSVLLDNENKLIKITDKAKENFIEIKTEDGTMKLSAKSKLTITVGDNITITLNGESGAVKIEASEVNIKATNQIKAETDGMFKVEAAQVSQSASSMFKAGSDGMTRITGSPIKIG